MGLRPSVNNNESNNSRRNPTNNDSIQHHEGNQSLSTSNSISSTSTSSTAEPQREAWTVRGQLLLNFHHAISRAINSPEMSRKCSQIAADMSRNEEMTSQKYPQLATAANQADATTKSASPSPDHSMADQYSAEAALIVENKSKRDATVRNKSIALGLLSFMTLRSCRGLSSWVRKSIATNSSSSGRSYQFDRMLNGKHMESPATAATAGVVSLKQQPSKLRKFFQFALDATISTSITLLSGTFLFMPRPSSYIEDMSKLPLVEGKSVYAEMVCPPLVKEYRRVLEQYGGRWPVMGTALTGDSRKMDEGQGDDAKSQLTQEDVSLNVIREFVENCSKRSKYERALLEERNALSSFENKNHHRSTVSRMMRRITNRTNTDKERRHIGDSILRKETKLGTVSIPSPGVPDDIPVDLDQEVFSLVTDDEKEEEGGGEEK